MLFMGVCEFLTCVRSGEKRMASASAEPLQGESQIGEFGHAKTSWLMPFEVHIFLAGGE